MNPGQDLLHDRTGLSEQPPMHIRRDPMVERILQQMASDVGPTALVTEKITQRGHGRAQLHAIEVTGIHPRSEDEHQTRLPVGQPESGSEQIGGDLYLRTRPDARNGSHHPGPAIIRTTPGTIDDHLVGGQRSWITGLQQAPQILREPLAIATEGIEAWPTLSFDRPDVGISLIGQHRPPGR